MKRCPQCEFIYEDEQTTCDMDGAMLSFDKNGAAVDGPRSNAKSFAVPAIVGTVLAAVLVLAFYASPLLVAKPDADQLLPEQTAPSNLVSAPTPTEPVIEAPSISPSPEVVVEPTSAERAADSDRNHANSKAADSRLTIRRGLPPLPRVPSLPRLPPARAQKSPTSIKVTSPPKKQSKVESFFKKTGRVITKPFKF